MVMLVVSSLSMLVGNLLALKQNNIKRMLGYSSIAHFGYLLLLVLAGGSKFGLEGAVVYLTVYVVASLSAFGVLTLMSDAVSSRDADTLMDFRGLFWRRPYLASIFTLALFSLAGIPLTAGFIGKFYVVTAAVGAESFWGWIALAFVVLGSSIGIYFYLRTIVSLFLAKKNMFTYDAKLNWGQGTGGIMVMCSALYVLVFGIFPDRLMTLAKMVAESTFIGQ
jgi:NADH-quinone oxidoreductase subunit N